VHRLAFRFQHAALPCDGDGLMQLGVVDLDAMGAEGSLDLAHHEPVRPASPSMLSQGLDQLAHMIVQDVLPGL
jgi:hypothetical protein